MEPLSEIVARLTAKERQLAALLPLRETREVIHRDSAVKRLRFVVSKLSILSIRSR